MKSKKIITPQVVRGGKAVPLGKNFYYMSGRKHKDGGIDVGKDPKTGVEVEDGEVMHLTGSEAKVFSAVPILKGESPAEKVLEGENPTKVFNAQQNYKKAKGINDDGTKKELGGKVMNRKKFQDGGKWRKTTRVKNGKSYKVYTTNQGTQTDDMDIGKSLGEMNIAKPFDLTDRDPNRPFDVPTYKTVAPYNDLKGKTVEPFDPNYRGSFNFPRGGLPLGEMDIAKPTVEGNPIVDPTGKTNPNTVGGRSAIGVGRGRTSINSKSKGISSGTLLNTNILAPAFTSAKPLVEAKLQGTASGYTPVPTKEAKPSFIDKIGKTFKDNPGLLNDSIGIASNTIGSLIYNRANSKMLDRMKYSAQPIATQAVKLKTNININPQLDKMREMGANYERDVDSNTGSSRVALARKQRGRVAGMLQTNELYGSKENAETSLINADRANQQQVTQSNNESYNRWSEGKANFENAVNEKRAENTVGLVENLNAGVQDFITKGEKRRANTDNMITMGVGNPNVNPRILRDAGVKSITDKMVTDWDAAQAKQKANKQKAIASRTKAKTG